MHTKKSYLFGKYMNKKTVYLIHKNLKDKTKFKCCRKFPLGDDTIYNLGTVFSIMFKFYFCRLSIPTMLNR